MGFIWRDDERLSFLQVKDIEKETEEYSNISVTILADQGQAELLIVRSLSFLYGGYAGLEVSNELWKLVLCLLLFNIKNGLNGLFEPGSFICVFLDFEYSFQSWVLLDILVNKIPRCKSIACCEVITKSDCNLRLVVWILIHIWSQGMQLLRQGLVGMCLDA